MFTFYLFLLIRCPVYPVRSAASSFAVIEMVSTNATSLARNVDMSSQVDQARKCTTKKIIVIKYILLSVLLFLMLLVTAIL